MNEQIPNEVTLEEDELWTDLSEEPVEDLDESVEDIPISKAEKQEPKLPMWKRVVLILIVIAEIFLAISIYLNSKLDLIKRVSDTETTIDGDYQVMQDDDIVNILLIGEDHRAWEEADTGLSDTMIICSVNTKTNEITLCSLMRDMYVAIPDHGKNRINAAYRFGGAALLDQTIEQNFGVNIDHNVVIDFDGFLGALDVIGNLDIELSAEEADFLNRTKSRDLLDDADEVWTLKEGMNSMTPEQALAYARDRYTGNADWARTERQRKVINAAFEKMKDGSIPTIMKLANKVFPYITTDMGNSEMLGIIYTVATKDMTLNTDYHLPVDGTFTSQMINGMDVLVPDTAANARYLQQYLYGETYNGETVTVNDEGEGTTIESTTASSAGYSYSSGSTSRTTYSYAGGAYEDGTTAYDPYTAQSDSGQGTTAPVTTAATQAWTEAPTQAPTTAAPQSQASGDSGAASAVTPSE